MLLLLSFGVKAQNIQNYTITAGANESLIDGGGWTQLIGSDQIASSAVTPIGFETWFMGVRFTQFSVSTNGVLRFGSVPVVFQANTAAILDNARIAAFTGVGSGALNDTRLWRTETNGSVRYKLIGTVPNRTLVVDWVNIKITGDAVDVGISRFQIHVYETAPANTDGGLCKIIYGRMQAVGYNNSINIITDLPTTLLTRTGIGYLDGIAPDAQRYVLMNTNNHPSVAAANLSYGADLTNQVATALPFDINLNSTNNTARKFYNFNSPAPNQNVTFVSASCVSDNALLINWTAAAGNQVGYAIYRSDDDGATYDFITQVSSLATSFLNIGLTLGTTYMYRVFTVTEGRLSAVTVNNQVTATTTISPTVFSVISSNWNNLLTWSTSLIPLFTQNVIIGCIVPHTVVVNTNGVANNLTLETGSILNFNAGQTLTVQGDVTNNGTINLNGGTLIIEGNLINNAGAIVNVGNGTLRVQGNLQNNATATLNGNTGLFRLAGNFINPGIYNSNTSIMRFDGAAQQLINHTGTSSYNSNNIVTFNTTAALPLSVPSSGTGGGGGYNGASTTTLTDLTPPNYSAANMRVVSFTVPAGTYTGINNLYVNITHTWNSDIELYLVTPNNTVYSVAADMGGSGDNYDATFTMNNPPAPTGNTTIAGSFFPMESWTGYAGTYVGTWSLYIIDGAGGDDGDLNAASLTLNQASTPPPVGLQFHTLQMQNTGAGVRTQNTDIIINNSATWTTGVFRADNNHLLIFPDNATSSVAINASHADMLVRKIGNDAFNFPVGNAGWGAPIGISAPANVTDHFTANYVKQVTPFNPFSKEASIHHVGQCEYWILDRTSGVSNVVVTLSYDNVRSCTVGTTTGLKVVRWDGAVWRDHFNGGLIATPYTGVLSLGTVTNFSPFTLGASTDDNILPLTFLSFDAKPLESDAILDWTTTGELNHDYFEIERSINGQDFKGIGKIKNPISRNATKNTYSFVDKNVGIENREAYYRLKQVDTDGTFSYSDVKKVNWSINNSQNEALFVAYPNPFTDILTLDFSLDKAENIEISLIDMTGRIIKTISQSFRKGSHKVELNYLQSLAQGSYLLQFKTNTVQKTIKVVKM